MTTPTTTSPFNPHGFTIDPHKLGVAMLMALVALLLMAYSPSAHAEGLEIEFIDKIGCAIVTWMKGPLAVLIFIVVTVAVLIVGLIAKMDWARIITVAVIFGIIQGIFAVLAQTGIIMPAGCGV